MEKKIGNVSAQEMGCTGCFWFDKDDQGSGGHCSDGAVCFDVGQ